MASGAQDPWELVGGAQGQLGIPKASPWPETLKLTGRGGALSLGIYNHMVSRCSGTRLGWGSSRAVLWNPLEPSPATRGESGILFPTLGGRLRGREEKRVISNGCILYSCYLRQVR